jgi:serine/threonine protein kinase/tetratricopeptide (TPR) repeat protein
MAERIFGKYEKIRRLAQGGMGDVFLGRQSGVVGFDRLVILKSLRRDLAAEEGFIEQFLDEARVAANLNHPNVVSIYEVGEWQGVFYIAMEYIAGEDLSRLWYAAAKRGLGLPFSVTVKIIHDAALGLDHAHTAHDVHGNALRIVHRDISPQNIMVRGDGVTKVVDFGIAKAANKVSKTQVGTVKGKLQYMSPEQVKGELLDGRSDQFSLGVVLWEMCTGKRLFKAESEIDTLNKILSHPIPSPTTIVRNFPSELEEVILKMLERDKDRRYESCAAVARQLGSYLDRTNKSKSMTVAAFVQDVLGETLKAKTQDLTPDKSAEISSPSQPSPMEADKPRRADPEEAIATTEGAPVEDVTLGSIDDGRAEHIQVQRINGQQHRYPDFDALKAAIAGGGLMAGDRILLGNGKSMALMEHPQLASLFVQGLGVGARGATTMDASDTQLSTQDGPADAMPSPHALAPADQNLSLMAVPTPPLQADAAPATQPPSPPPLTQAAPLPLSEEHVLPAPAPQGGPTAHSLPPGYVEGPVAMGIGPVPHAGPAPHLSGPMPMPTGPWGPSAPPYQMPTSPPGYPTHYPQMAMGPDAWTAQTGNVASPSSPPQKKRSVWPVLLALLLIGAPVGLYVGDRPLFEELKAKVLGGAAPILAADALRAALYSDDEQALKDALRTVEPGMEQGDARARALSAAYGAMLHAGLATIELERGRLLDLEAADDTTRARADAALSTAETHRLAAYNAANAAMGLAAQLHDAYVAKAAYQGLLGATQEMEADFKRALDAASPDELKWLQAESESLRALVELRRATDPDVQSKDTLGQALKLVRKARSAEKSSGLPLVDRRLEYAEAALLAELVKLKAEDEAKTRGVIEALLRAQPRNDRLQLLSARIGAGKASAQGGQTASAASSTSPDHKPAEVEESYESLKRKADRARRAERTAQAVKLYKAALAKRRTASAYTGLGWAYLDQDQPDAAVEAFEAALRRAPNLPVALFGQAEALRFAGRTSAAARAYKDYLEVAPDGEDAPVARRALKRLGG